MESKIVKDLSSFRHTAYLCYYPETRKTNHRGIYLGKRDTL